MATLLPWAKVIVTYEFLKLHPHFSLVFPYNVQWKDMQFELLAMPCFLYKTEIHSVIRFARTFNIFLFMCTVVFIKLF